MSKLSNAVNEAKKAEVLSKELRLDETKTNYMGGDNYIVDPLTRLKLISASSIYGEAQYYVPGGIKTKHEISTDRVRQYMDDARKYDEADEDDNTYSMYCDMMNDDILSLFSTIGIVGTSNYAGGVTTADIMEDAIDAALDYDFGATLEWAASLRNDFYIRLNPQVILVRAAVHPKRKEWTDKHPGEFDRYNKKVMRRADDAMSQMAYYMYTHDNKKNNVPSILKRSWANKISHCSRYELAKYKNHEIGMINAVRICHANNSDIDELMRTGTIEVTEDDETWERMRSRGASWAEILEKVDMGHMAVLRNLKNFFIEVDDMELARKYIAKLRSGVLGGKQFPFRYYSAYKVIESCEEVNHKMYILDALEDCIDISIANMPKLKGRTMCLSDNSGSAWYDITTEYGSMITAEIDNLSAVITAMCSDEGFVGKFGDTLRVFPISKTKGALRQAMEISRNRHDDVGGNTEGGIWKFFDQALRNREHWDNIFIYSDQQAGTGGLYGDFTLPMSDRHVCKKGYHEQYINVYKLVIDYRNKVNSKVNVFSIQTAGYDSCVVPSQAYRISLLSGWTGKEAQFASAVTKLWDDLDKANKVKH